MLPLLEEKYALKMARTAGKMSCWGEERMCMLEWCSAKRKGTFHTLKACITIRQIWQVLFIKNIYITE